MTKEQKYKNIEALVSWLSSNNAIYLTDISGLNAKQISIFRNECFKFQVKTKTIKNSLFKKALEFNKNKEFDPFYDILKGNTTISISNINNLPAKIIKNFRIKTGINNKPIIKGVYIDKCFYIGNNHLETLIRIKSKEELIYEIFKLLNFTIINLISTLKVNNNIFNILHSLQINNKINKLNKMTDLKQLAEQLVNLTVKEVNELSMVLEKEYNIKPSNTVTIPSVSNINDAKSQKKEEKNIFDVILKSVGTTKLAIMKLVKDITGKSLTEAKELVDSATNDTSKDTVIKTGINKEEAEKIKKQFEEKGAEIELK